jgi:hypothetical protein
VVLGIDSKVSYTGELAKVPGKRRIVAGLLVVAIGKLLSRKGEVASRVGEVAGVDEDESDVVVDVLRTGVAASGLQEWDLELVDLCWCGCSGGEVEGPNEEQEMAKED